jgi:hypothetical protein
MQHDLRRAQQSATTSVTCECISYPCACDNSTQSTSLPIDYYVECPLIDYAALTCPNMYCPYACGNDGCWFDNACYAESVGYAIDVNCTEAEFCPYVNSTSQCGPSKTAYTCSNLGCWYNSKCEAELAHFDVAADCQPSETCPYFYSTPDCAPSCTGYLCGDMSCWVNSKC